MPLFLFSFETFHAHYEGPMGRESGRDVGVFFVDLLFFGNKPRDGGWVLFMDSGRSGDEE